MGQEPWTPAPEAPGLAFLLLPRVWKSRRGWGPAEGPARERELAGAGDSAAVGPGWPDPELRQQSICHGSSWWAASGGLKHLTFREPKAPSRAPLASASRPELHHPCPLLCTPITRELLVKPLPSSQATRPQLMTAHISLLPSHTLQPDDTPALGVQGPDHCDHYPPSSPLPAPSWLAVPAAHCRPVGPSSQKVPPPGTL